MALMVEGTPSNTRTTAGQLTPWPREGEEVKNKKDIATTTPITSVSFVVILVLARINDLGDRSS